MLESRSDLVLCGGIVRMDSVEDVYCNITNGELVFETPDGAVNVIGELTLTEPAELPSTDNVVQAIRNKSYGECIGLVYSKKGVVVINSETKASLVSFAKVVQKEITIDLNLTTDEYEEEE